MSDVFDSAIASLQSTLSEFTPLVTPVDSAAAAVGDIDTLLNDINSLIDDASDIDQAMTTLGEVLEFLEPIPIIGELAGPLASALSEASGVMDTALSEARSFQSETLTPMATTLNDVQTGLGDIRSVVVDLGQKIPGYLNTVEILSYLLEIAQPLTEVLEGTDAADRLNELVTELTDVKTKLGSALAEVNPVLSTIGKEVAAFSGIVTSIKSAMGSGVGDAINGLNSAASALSPMNHAFQRVEEAIKPLAWVLHALSCIFNKILKPVINAILNATGLSALVNDATDAIFKKIGISSAIASAKGNLSLSNISGSTGALDSSHGQTANVLWQAVDTAFGEYKSGNSGSQLAITSLVTAITGAAIDPNKPSTPPPFPAPLPTMTGVTGVTGAPGTAVAALPPAAQALYVSRVFDSAPRIIKTLASPAPRPHAQSLSTLIALASGAATPPAPIVAPIDAAIWPDSAALVSSIAGLGTKLDTLAPAAAAFESALKVFDHSLSLPATFQQQVTSMGQLFTDAVTLLDFLSSLGLPVVDSLVKPLDDIAHSQLTEMNAVKAQMPVLQTTMTALENAAAQVLAAVPQTSVIDRAVIRADGWSLSISQTVQIMEQAKATDASQGGKHAADVSDCAQRTESIARAISVRVASLEQQTDSLVAAIGAMQSGLNDYAASLQTITAHSALITATALPTLTKAVHTLDLVSSIVDPLSHLLKATGCTDATSPMKTFAVTQGQAINQAGMTKIQQPQVFASFAESLAEKMLPLNDLATSVAQAAKTISTSTVAAFETNAQSLAAGLTAMAQELIHTDSFQISITTKDNTQKTVTVDNDFFSQDIIDKANALTVALTPSGQTFQEPIISGATT
jgi:hypothetical protein